MSANTTRQLRRVARLVTPTVRSLAAATAVIVAATMLGAARAERRDRGAPPSVPAPRSGDADPTRLPVAARQLPDFAAYRGRELRAGQHYRDPVTGAVVWRVTDAATPVAGQNGAHDYAAGPVQVSRDWGGGHTLLVLSTGGGGERLVDFVRGVGFRNWRQAPPVNADMSFTFSLAERTPRLAYYVQGATLRRYDTQTGRDAPGAGFPHDFSAVTTKPLLWLQQDRHDRRFVMMPNDQSLVIAWDAATNRTRTLTRAQAGVDIDEPHLERDGRWVMVTLGPPGGGPDWLLWDLESDTHTGPISKGMHPAAVRSLFVSMDPDVTAAPQWSYDPARRAQATILTASRLSAEWQHHADQWVQDDASLGGDLHRQWVLWSGAEDGIASVRTWSRVRGEVYVSDAVDYAPQYEKPRIGVQSVRQLAPDGRRVLRQLTRAPSADALVEGSFHFDAGTQRVWVWAVGGGSPAGRVALRAPGTIHDGIGFVRADGSDVRLLAHHYSLPAANGYWDLPRATASPDGRVVLFDSNMNVRGGRSDVFLVEVPTAP